MKEKLENKREAIVQALANLKIDGISVYESYLLDYENKVTESLNINVPKLMLKFGGNTGINK